MKIKSVSTTKRTLFGMMLLCVTGASVAGSSHGSLSLRLFSGFPHTSAVDFHYFPNANVYFSYSTGHYYYPSNRGWSRSRVLPPNFRVHPRERLVVQGDGGHSWHYKQRRRHHGYRSHQQRGWQGWGHGRRQHQYGGDGRRNDRHGDSHERGGRHRG